MATLKDSTDRVDQEASIDPNTSPMGSIVASTTPDTEVSPPTSPFRKGDILKHARLAARQKLLTLTTDEKVRGDGRLQPLCCLRSDGTQISLLTAADFWRTKAIPFKGIPAAKTSDGPNGARGGTFVGGTKACSPLTPRGLFGLQIF